MDRVEALLQRGGSQVQVVIKYKTIRPGLKDEEKLIAKARIRQLAFELSPAREADLCLFQCLGLIDDSIEPPRYGLVLKMTGISIGYSCIEHSRGRL
jgi:hypothetical protein